MTSGFIEGTENGVKISIAIYHIICYRPTSDGRTYVYTTSNQNYSTVHHIVLDQPYDVVNAMLQNYIDKEGLIEVINANRKRYSAAYAQGWADCKKYYQERLDDIAALASKEVRPE